MVVTLFVSAPTVETFSRRSEATHSPCKITGKMVVTSFNNKGKRCYTSDFRHNMDSCHLQKFSDDTAIV